MKTKSLFILIFLIVFFSCEKEVSIEKYRELITETKWVLDCYMEDLKANGIPDDSRGESPNVDIRFSPDGNLDIYYDDEYQLLTWTMEESENEVYLSVSGFQLFIGPDAVIDQSAHLIYSLDKKELVVFGCFCEDIDHPFKSTFNIFRKI